MPGYFLNSFDAAVALIEEAKAPNLRLQFDIYHRQIMHGDVTMALRKLLPITGHIQIAGVPARHEPDDNELNYSFLISRARRAGLRRIRRLRISAERSDPRRARLV